MPHVLRKFLGRIVDNSTTAFRGLGIIPLMFFGLVGLGGILVGSYSVSPMTAMRVIGFLGLFVAILMALRFPFYGFLLFVMTLPLEAALVLEVGFTIRPSYLALVGITFIILSQFVLDSPSGSFNSPLTLTICVYLGISAFSLIMTILSPPSMVDLVPEVKLRGSELRSLVQIAFLLFSSLVYFYTVYFCSDASRIGRAIRIHIYTAVVLSIYGIYQFLAYILELPFLDITNALGTGGGIYQVAKYGSWYYFRSHGTFQEPLNFGHYLLSALPLVFALALYPRSSYSNVWRPMKTYSVPILLMSSALFLTRSRGAWLGFLGGMLSLLIIVVNWKSCLKILSTISVGSAAIHLAMTFFLPDAYEMLWKAVAERFSEGQLAYEPRFHFFPFTIALFQQYPILGVGIGNYPLHQAAEFGFGLLGTAYGVFWQALVETGILGFLAFSFLLLHFYYVLFRALRQAKNGPWYPYLLGYLACFTAMMTQYLFLGDRLNLYVWFLMGLAISTARLVEREKAAGQ